MSDIKDMVQLTVAIAYNDKPQVVHQETIQYSFELTDPDWMKSFIAFLNEENKDDNIKSSIIT
jgi:hypothetical protein